MSASEPLVCCVMLTKDRPQMTARAVECFRAQTYDPIRRYLVIIDTGAPTADGYTSALVLSGSDAENETHDWQPRWRNLSVGELRNQANSYSLPGHVIMHWDSDDWSHPERITEQVALLRASGKEAVGYREMLFWDTHNCTTLSVEQDKAVVKEGATWLYSNGNPRYCLGTSLCYWRSVWERRPFEDKAYGEDTAWLLGVDSLGITAMARYVSAKPLGSDTILGIAHDGMPRMIASIHDGNTSPAYRAEMMRASEKQNGEWKRATAWDDFCRATMQL